MNEKQIKEMKVLNIGEFDKKHYETELKNIFSSVQEDINFLKSESDKRDIYLNLNERDINEKRILNKFHFLRLFNISIGYSYTEDLLNDVERCFNNRINQVLREIKFISLDEKKQTIKVKKRYNFLDYNEFYKLGYIGFNIKKEDVEILKEYKNLNVEFKFKSHEHYETFKNIVFWSNKETEFISNNTPDGLIKAYKEKQKIPHENEFYLIYEFARDKGINTNKTPINQNVINKAWGC